jgi:hypothetical protein
VLENQVVPAINYHVIKVYESVGIQVKKLLLSAPDRDEDTPALTKRYQQFANEYYKKTDSILQYGSVSRVRHKI